MINDGINNVPDKTVAIFLDDFSQIGEIKDRKRFFNIIDKPPKKRDWFDPHFYRCLPLSIGNQYGFILKTEYDMGFMWDGGNNKEAIKFYITESEEALTEKFPRIESHFGHGIITISNPFWFRTPPGVNLMTVNPPNYVIPNVTVMTGVVETDNLRRSFTFNLKIQIPNIEVFLPAGTPLAGFIPIPRNYADSFELKYADEIFNENLINEELNANIDTATYREEVEKDLKHKVGRQYLLGKDVYGNKFKDHQTP